MHASFEMLITGGLPLDMLGLFGLALVAVAAIRLSSRHRSWGGNTMAIGATMLFLARLWMILSPRVMTMDLEHALGPVFISLTIGLPPLFLSFGVAAVVLGFWSHERWLREVHN
jgi:hypothetical protein